jgi:hypothetical protein
VKPRHKLKGKHEPRPHMLVPSPLAASYVDALVARAVPLVERVQHMLAGSAGEWIATEMRKRLRAGLSERDMVIAAAYAGDALAHEVLMGEFHELLDEGEMPPASLREYARKTELHSKRGKGRVWWDDWRRNYAAVTLMAAIGLEFPGLEATRNKTTEKPCCASIASAALRCRGIKMSESRLTNLWGQLGEFTIAMVAAWRVLPELFSNCVFDGDDSREDLSMVARAKPCRV